jgi:hypothetical protein
LKRRGDSHPTWGKFPSTSWEFRRGARFCRITFAVGGRYLGHIDKLKKKGLAGPLDRIIYFIKGVELVVARRG